MTAPTKSPTVCKINNKPIDLALTVGRVMYGKQNGADIGDFEHGPLATMFIDPTALASTIWANYQDKLAEIGLEDEDAFYSIFGGQLRRDVEAALKEALKDFFSWGEAVLTEIEARIAKMGEAMKNVDPSGQTFGNSPESSEPTPDPSPTPS